MTPVQTIPKLGAQNIHRSFRLHGLGHPEDLQAPGAKSKLTAAQCDPSDGVNRMKSAA